MRRSAAAAPLTPALLAPVLLAAAMSGLLVGCAPSQPSSSSTAASEPPASTEPVAADPELDAFLSAIAGHTPTDPDALVASVEAAGFPRDAIERTREVDSLGAPVTFLEIAVLDGDSCIVGQVGDGEPIAVRASPLGGGRCLVGEIVTVD